jgi:hypothetical protein
MPGSAGQLRASRPIHAHRDRPRSRFLSQECPLRGGRAARGRPQIFGLKGASASALSRGLRDGEQGRR